MFEIEKGVPIPASRSFKYPFKNMEVGDSFFCQHQGVRSSAMHFGRRHKTKYKSIVEGNGYRVWRIE